MIGAISTACSRGSIEAVELLIKKGANINVISSLPRGFTPIMAAAVAGHADVVQILIEHGADLTIRNGAGNTILEAAMAHGHHDTVGILLEALGGDDYPQESIALDIAMANSNTTIREIMVSSGLIDSTVQEPENIHSVDWILEQGGDMVKPRAMSNMMYGALYANALDVVAALLANGCDPNKHLSPEQTPLHFAVDQNNIPLIDLLLNWGANPAIEAYGPDDLTYTPLHQALIALDRDRGKDTSTIDRLLASGRCKLMTGNDARSSAFGYVLSHYSRWTHGVAEIMIFRMIQSIEDIHEDRSDDGSTLMHAAVWHGRVDLVDILLSKGANINAIDHQGCTSFILECQRGTRMLGCLLARGADPHAKDIDSQCALHAAAAQGNLKAINFLLNIGLPVDVLDRDQYTPLVWAVITGQEDAALHLLKRGARLETKKLRRGRTLLHIAASLGMERLVTILLRNTDLDVNAKDDMGWTPLALACRKGSPQLLTTFLEAGADIETANDTLDRPLHLALIACNLIGARLLIWGGADITARGSHGRTPLHFAAKHVNLHLVRLLIRHDASISALDDAGQTPLCLCSGSDIAQVFIDQGASADHVDKYGWTPLHHAVANGQVNVFKVLLRAGGRLDARTIDDGLSVSERIEDLLDERLRTAFEDSVSGVQRGEVDQKRCLYDL
jgi:ankyrin repeat protein